MTKRIPLYPKFHALKSIAPMAFLLGLTDEEAQEKLKELSLTVLNNAYGVKPESIEVEDGGYSLYFHEDMVKKLEAEHIYGAIDILELLPFGDRDLYPFLIYSAMQGIKPRD